MSDKDSAGRDEPVWDGRMPKPMTWKELSDELGQQGWIEGSEETPPPAPPTGASQ